MGSDNSAKFSTWLLQAKSCLIILGEIVTYTFFEYTIYARSPSPDVAVFNSRTFLDRPCCTWPPYGTWRPERSSERTRACMRAAWQRSGGAPTRSLSKARCPLAFFRCHPWICWPSIFVPLYFQVQRSRKNGCLRFTDSDDECFVMGQISSEENIFRTLLSGESGSQSV